MTNNETSNQRYMLTQEQLIEIYDQSMEDWPHAGVDVTDSKSNFSDALESYLAAIQYETFLFAYAKGYEAGRKPA